MARNNERPGSGFSLPLLVLLSLSPLVGACDQQPEDSLAQPAAEKAKTTQAVTIPEAPASPSPGTVQKGVFFSPDLEGFTLQNEYEDDGDGDGINETHVRRYVDDQGNSAFVMSTNDIVWAWSLDASGDDDREIHENYVVRDSNCDGVIDERYSLDAQFHVPDCVTQGGAADH